MRKTTSGFTIVELLIVIVVIAILASITVVAFNGVQKQARNTARHSEVKQWLNRFELYAASNGQYPVAAEGGYCLGTGFPIGNGGVARCRDYVYSNNSYLESASTGLMNDLSEVASITSGINKPVGTTVGPYVEYGPVYINIFGVFEGAASAECPSDMSFNYTNGSSKLLCIYQIRR